MFLTKSVCRSSASSYFDPYSNRAVTKESVSDYGIIGLKKNKAGYTP